MIWDKAQKKFKEIQHEIFCYRDQDYKVECEVHTYAEIAPLKYEILKFITLTSESGRKPNEIISSGFDGLRRDKGWT